MTEEYAFCKSVTIENLVDGPRPIDLLVWLKDQGLEKDFDFTMVRNHQIINGMFGPTESWTFHFDHAKHAVMFKLVWGGKHEPLS